MIGGSRTLLIPIPLRNTIEEEVYIQTLIERLRPIMPTKIIPKAIKIGFSKPYFGTSRGVNQPSRAKETGGNMPMILWDV